MTECRHQPSDPMGNCDICDSAHKKDGITPAIYKGRRVDNKEWVTGQLIVPDDLVSRHYILPKKISEDFYPVYEAELYDCKGIAIGHFHEVDPETISKAE